MKRLLPLLIAAQVLFTAIACGQDTKSPGPKNASVDTAVESDSRLQSEGKGWRLDRAAISDSERPRVLLIGDSILNGYLKHVVRELKGSAYVDAWVNPHHQSEHLNKLLADVLDQGPYDVVHFNMGLHGWTEGRIKPGTFEPLTKAYVEVLQSKLPNAKLIWANSTPVTMQDVPTRLEPEINPTIVEHNRMAAKVMAEMNVPVSDFYGMLIDNLDLAKGDRFHWTAPAYKQLGQYAVHSIQRALAPSTIHRAQSLPTSTPWDLNKLSKAPTFTWDDAGDEPNEIRKLYYASEPYEGKATRVFAYYASPDTIAGKTRTPDATPAKKFPAVVLVHGGGGAAFPQWAKLWAERGYAAIAMDLAGVGPDKQRLTDGGPGQGHDMKFETIGKPVTEQWTYHAVANVIRAHSLIRTFPEVDANRTAVTGISWGGYLTCIVSGLDDRFRAAVPVYGCGFLKENSCWLGDFAKMSPEQQTKWVNLWDPSQYVGSAAMPILFVNGGKDFAYPPDSHVKTYSLPNSPKFLHVVPNLPHGHIFDKPAAVEAFIEHHLKGGTRLAQVVHPQRDDTTEGETVTAVVTSSAAITEATQHFTRDDLSGDARKRTWTSTPAKINDQSIQAAAPPSDATAWFLTAKDDRGIVVSSPLVAERPARKGKGQLVPNTQMTPYQIMTALRATLDADVSQAQRSEYRGAFRDLDTDGNQKLTRNEYVDNGKAGTPQSQQQIFKAADQNRNKSLNEAEYITSRVVIGEANNVLKNADADNNQRVSREEFLAKAPEAAWAPHTFAALDANGDDQLQSPELLKVWSQWHASPKAPPTPHENVKYGPYDRNVFDIWLPDSEKPTALIVFIHGGGFTGGSKDGAWRSPNVQMALDRGVAFATIQYRYRYGDNDFEMSDPQRAGIQHVLRDSARAVQFIRANAAKYNLDKSEIACYGGSAGAGTSLWLASHDDLADPDNEDPVLRESSRIAAAGLLAGQFTYDLARWDIEFKSRGGNIFKTHGRGQPEMAYWRFFGLSKEAYNGEEGKKWRKDVDMHGMITSDDAPVFLMSSMANRKPINANVYNHHPYHAQLVESACKAKGVEVVCLVPQVREKDAQTLKKNPSAMMEFFFKHLGVSDE